MEKKKRKWVIPPTYNDMLWALCKASGCLSAFEMRKDDE